MRALFYNLQLEAGYVTKRKKRKKKQTENSQIYNHTNAIRKQENSENKRTFFLLL